jgi:hypothetical protein
MVHNPETFRGVPRDAFAYHEAAHAVVLAHAVLTLPDRKPPPDPDHAVVLLAPGDVTIDAGGPASASGWDLDRFAALDEAEQRYVVDAHIVSSLAGPLATVWLGVLSDEARRTSAIDDERDALRYARDLFPTDSEARAYVESLRPQVIQVLESHGVWPSVVGVATRLLERGTVSGDEVVAVVDAALTG